MKTSSAIIHATLAIGSSITAPFYDVNISQQLCMPACADEVPVFAPKFSVNSIENVGTNQYVINIHVEGAISYVPCGCGCCQTKSQVLSADFTIPVYSASAVTGATITAGATKNGIAKHPCKECSRDFVSNTPLTVVAVTA